MPLISLLLQNFSKIRISQGGCTKSDKKNPNMFFSFLLLAKSENLILDESSHEYIVDCSTGFTIDVMPSKKMSIIYFSNQKGSKIAYTAILDGKKSDVQVKDDEFEKGIYKTKIDNLGENPLRFDITCPTNTGSMTIALRGTQNVTSDAILFALIVTCIVVISFVILIILFQFCTFHHRKSD